MSGFFFAFLATFVHTYLLLQKDPLMHELLLHILILNVCIVVSNQKPLVYPTITLS